MENYVELMGHIMNDPLFYDEEDSNIGIPYCTFDVECEQKSVEKEGTEWAFFSCYAVNQTASFIDESFIKGMPIHLSGRIYMRTQVNEEGSYFITTEILVEKAKYEGEDRRERAANGEFVRKTRREQRLHRRAVGQLMREQFGAPSWEDLFTKEELNNIPYNQHYKVRKEREKVWYEKKGIPDPYSMVSDEEIETLSIEELNSILSQRTGEWFEKAAEEQMRMTEKNLGRYFLEQRVIPDRLFLGEGKLFIASLPKLGGRDLYSQLVIRENLRIGGGYKCPYSPNQFVIKTRRLWTTDNKQEFGMSIIEMPEPESVPLCAFLIICHDSKLEQIRYYTIEKAIGRGHYMLCEVDEERRHLNYGDAPDSYEEIIEKINELYTDYLNTNGER